MEFLLLAAAKINGLGGRETEIERVNQINCEINVN